MSSSSDGPAGIDTQPTLASDALENGTMSAYKRKLMRIYGNACRGKKRFGHEQQAQDFNRKFGDPKLEAYRCPFCDGWHNGHKMKSANRKNMARILADPRRDWLRIGPKGRSR